MITDERAHLVVKSNELIRKRRYDLTAQEQKILLYLISKIKPEDTGFQDYTFHIKNFCEVCGIDGGSGKNYSDLKIALQALRDKSFYVWTANKEETPCSWINKLWINRGNGTVRVRLDEDLKPYLLQLRENFTSYELVYILVMRGKYSIRLYEILKSYYHIGYVECRIDDLKDTLDTASYLDYRDFRKNVLDKPIEEINTCTDLNITYQPKRTGRTITSIIFDIKKKESFDDRLKAMKAIEGRIGQGASNG